MLSSFNLLDLIIVFVIFFYLREGFVLGFTVATLDLAGFILSFIIALKFYGVVANLLMAIFSWPLGLANAAGFFLTALVSEIALALLFRKLLKLAPRLRHGFGGQAKIPSENVIYKGFKQIDHWLGLIPGALSAFIVLSFILTVIVSLPTSPLIKRLVTGSGIGSKLIANTSFFENKLNDVFGGALNETLNFLTVKPESDESVNLRFKVENGAVDKKAEQEMFRLVNTERAKAGLQLLSFDEELAEVARDHSQDMFRKGYFSHYTPDGLSPFDRMESAGIEYTFAGENLALAPSTALAHQGLMNSPGHRANILNPNFNKVGIGAIDGGIYGTMFSQEFTN